MEILRSTFVIGLNRRWICCSQLCSCPLYIHNSQGQSICQVSSTRPPWKPALRPCYETGKTLTFSPIPSRRLSFSASKHLQDTRQKTMDRTSFLKKEGTATAANPFQGEGNASCRCRPIGFSPGWCSQVFRECEVWSSELKLLRFE